MATYLNLSLQIYGGAAGKDLDRQPCVEVGSIPKAFSATAPVLVNEREAWMITHVQDYTLYTTSYQGFHTADNQPGHILICLFVPAQKRLADGHSPLELLEALKDTFVVQALRGGKLPQSPVDAAPYKALLDKYRLEERSILLPVMQGNAPASFCVESKKQLDAIMRHSRYPSLTSVGRLELGFSCPSTIMLTSKGKPSSPQSTTASPNIPLQKDTPLHLEPEMEPGGLTLDDGPDDTPPSKKKKKWLVMVVALATLGVYMAIDPFNTNTQETVMVENSNESEWESEDDWVVTDSVEEDYVVYDTVAVFVDPIAKEAIAQAAKEQEAKEKAAQAAAEKAKKEQAAKEAALKRQQQEEAASLQWQTQMGLYAASCPIQLRLGVNITAIDYSAHAVTFTVEYQELSKYNMDDSDQETLKNDRSSIRQKYASDLPSKVSVRFSQKDKAGRLL